MVRAKYRVDENAATTSGSTIRMSPVTGGSEENKKFFRWTPGGRIEMSTINEEAAKQFVPGAEFYVDFSLAKDPDPKTE